MMVMGLRPDQDPLPVLSGPALLDPEVSIPKAGRDPLLLPARRALRDRAQGPSRRTRPYYNSFVRSLPLSMPNCVVH